MGDEGFSEGDYARLRFMHWPRGWGGSVVTLMPPLSEHGLPDSVTVCRQ